MSTRILIAEDDDIQSAVLLAAITSRGYEAEVVTGGLEAVRRLRTGRYDLALLDYGLPEVDGLSAARLMQDLLEDESRPRLIAVTASARQLQEKELVGGSSFDAVVSKGQGLSVLLAVIDENLALSAKLRAAAALLHDRQRADEAAAQRRVRRMAPLAALPAAAMAAVFAIAFCCTAASLGLVRHSMREAHQTTALGATAGALIDAVHDAHTSQLTYLATGLESHRNQFQASAERVDHLLAEPSSLQQADLPADPATAIPYSLVQSWLGTLGQEALAHPTPSNTGLTNDADLSEAREKSAVLRQWADAVVSHSQDMVLAGLHALDTNAQIILVVLAAGMLYGLYHAIRAARRQYASAATTQPVIWPAFRTSTPDFNMDLAAHPIRPSLLLPLPAGEGGIRRGK